MSDDHPLLRSYGRLKSRPIKPRQAALMESLLPGGWTLCQTGGNFSGCGPKELATETSCRPLSSFTKSAIDAGRSVITMLLLL